MYLIEELISFFALDVEVITFNEFAFWFVKSILTVEFIVMVIRGMFNATWKIERSLR